MVERQKRLLDTHERAILSEVLRRLQRTSVSDLARGMLPLADAPTRKLKAARKLQERAEEAEKGSLRD